MDFVLLLDLLQTKVYRLHFPLNACNLYAQMVDLCLFVELGIGDGYFLRAIGNIRQRKNVV